MALAGTENRLFANHPVAIDMVNCAATIGDPPMPRDQLHRFVTAIFDANMIGPEPASLRGRRLIHQKFGATRTVIPSVVALAAKKESICWSQTSRL